MAYTLLHDASGAAVSVGTKVASPLPAGLTAVALTDQEAADLLGGRTTWDATTRALVPVPVPPIELTAEEKLVAIKAELAALDGLSAPVVAADIIDALVRVQGVI